MKTTLKRIIICFLSAILLLSGAGCKNKKTDIPKKNNSTQESSSESGGSEDIPSDNISFDGKKNDGSFSDTTSQIKPAPQENYPDYTKVYGVSQLAKSEDLKFFYKGMTYAYGITENGNEVIALIDQNNGDYIDILSGAGKPALRNKNNLDLVSVSGIRDFERSMSDGFMRLEVYYTLSGVAAAGSELITTYTFKDSTINVSQHISYKSDRYAASPESSYTERMVMQKYKLKKADVVGKWKYPANGDYPYQVSESVATVLEFDENHRLYTFLKTENEDEVIYSPEYPEINIPLSFSEGKGVNYTVSYDLVPATVTGGKNDNYYALFRGRGSDYAVGVFPAAANTEDSTVFVGKSVDLNLNVSNLVSKDVNFSLRYDIRDYYGKVVDSGLFIDNTAYAGTSMNRKIHISGSYGMYYMNIYAMSDVYTHLECYPFALIPTADYKYRATNPFGMTSIADNGCKDDAMTAAKLNVKIGVGCYRVVANATGYQMDAARYMHDNGISLNAQLNINNVKPTGLKSVNELVSVISDYAGKLKGLTDDIEVGNETNFSYSEGKEADPAAYAEKYLSDMYEPASKAVRAAGYKYLGAGISGCDRGWLNDVIGKTRRLWNLMDVLSVHPYGFPCMPDIYGNGSYSNKWNYEGSLMRVKDIFKKNGELKWYITETGYPVSPAKPLQVELRTQADYDMRIMVLGHSYGASKIELYCFYDRLSFGSGFNADDTEMGYGMFYQPDFLGVVKPKPVAAALAVLNHVTDGLKKTESSAKYTRADGTLRAFKMSLSGGKNIYTVWSNKYPLCNAVVGNQNDREPSLPWTDQWSGKYEDVTFDAAGSKVTVTDVMGNTKTYTAVNGKVTVPVSGSPLYIDGIK